MLDRFPGGPVAGVAATEHHADPRHLIDHAPPEIGEPRIVVLAAAAEAVVEVVGDQHPAHAEGVVRFDKLGQIVHGHPTFEVERNAQLSLPLGTTDVAHLVNQQVPLGMLFDPAPERGQHLEPEVPGELVEGNIEAHERGTALPVPFKLVEEFDIAGTHRHAGMVVPNDCIGKQFPGPPRMVATCKLRIHGKTPLSSWLTFPSFITKNTNSITCM